MGKFCVKFFIIFVSLISLIFFSLTFFQSYSAHRAMKDVGIEYRDTLPPPPSEIENPPNIIPLALIILISSIFIYLILKYIEKTFVTPLSVVEKNIAKIEKGNLDIEFPNDTKGESKTVSDLYFALNKMVMKLRERESLRDNFIQNLVHDLRAPITAQERAMDILQEELKDNELISALAENNNAYLNMVNKIIEILSEKEIKIKKTKVNLDDLADSVFLALKPMADEKKIALYKDFGEDYIVFADYLSLNRIILNLITNAIENLDCDKSISLKLTKNKNYTKITVEDNAGKIKNADNLFEKYVSNSKNKLISGLGLSIVRELVTKNDGTIKIESKENEYTRFVIELPSGKENEI